MRLNLHFLFKILIVLAYLNISSLLAQSIYEPTYKNHLYNFLERLSSKNQFNLFSDIKPLTRKEIAKSLLTIGQLNNLTIIEKERLSFYTREYGFELKYLQNDTTTISEFIRFGKTNRLNFFKYFSQDFFFSFDPVIGIGYNFSDKTYHQYGGVQFKGRIDDNWGFYFNYRDNIETGKEIDRSKSFSESTGINVLRRKPELIDYSETRGGITYEWSKGNITAAKDFIKIGSSSQSSVILSDKAPSFPFFRIDLYPTDWFRYNFIHAWLDSDLIDSNSVRFTGVTSTVLKRPTTYSRLQKYYVSHSFSFQPAEDLWLTFGESIIYGDNLEYVYFLPVFYRLADHYNSIGGGDSGDNAQLFFNASYIWSQIKSKFYTTLYIDEFSPSDLFSGGDNAQVFAFTLGGNFTNPLWNDNYITLEYNAIRPYVGMNADPLHTYESSGYPLGHWIGSNAVQIYAEMEQYFPYMITAKAFYSYVIKGEKENINDYYNRVTSTYPLLSGDNSYYSELGLKLSYNPLHDLYLELNLSYINKSTGRFETEYKIDKGLSIGTMLRYGFQ